MDGGPLQPPSAIAALGAERAAARERRDFGAADELRARIEDAGWRVVDDGLDFHLEPLRPLDREVAGRTLHGSSAAVPSLFSEPSTERITVVVALDHGQSLDSVASLPSTFPADASLVAVADGSSSTPGLADAETIGCEMVWTAGAFGLAAAFNAGMRRATGGLICLCGPDAEIDGGINDEILAPLVDAFADDSVAVAGAFGLTTADLRAPGPSPLGDVVGLDAAFLAFRRGDAIALGPLDERLRTSAYLGLWWSLVLRNGGPDLPVRRAVALDLPVRRRSAQESPHDARLARRDYYRVLDAFGRRPDLLRL